MAYTQSSEARSSPAGMNVNRLQSPSDLRYPPRRRSIDTGGSSPARCKQKAPTFAGALGRPQKEEEERGAVELLIQSTEIQAAFFSTPFSTLAAAVKLDFARNLRTKAAQ